MRAVDYSRIGLTASGSSSGSRGLGLLLLHHLEELFIINVSAVNYLLSLFALKAIVIFLHMIMHEDVVRVSLIDSMLNLPV